MTRLSFADQDKPGITRRKAGHGWAYFDPDGTRIKDRDEIDRLNAIALPPAYRDAWFAPSANAHLLAFGFDAKGRKQYRYHPDFRSTRESVKYDSLAAFGKALPKLRKRVAKDVARRKPTYERAVASVVRLLDGGEIRIGNEAYAKSNKSFGATTLLMRHVKIKRGKMELRFKAKSGKEAQVEVTDKSLLRFVRDMQDLPGQHLFQYVDKRGEVCPVGSSDVNAYIRDAMGEDFTAKHFRTWAASVCGYSLVLAQERHVGVKELASEVSCRLNNTPAVSRKSYIHPAVTALAQDPKAQDKARAKVKMPRARTFMTAAERAFLAFIAKAPKARTLLKTA